MKMKSDLLSLRSLSVLLALVCLPVAQAVNYLISFGDSYSQTGFDVHSVKPSSSNPLGNPAYPGWTASGGANWVGYLVKDYNASILFSYNFAYGGATVDTSLVKPYEPTVKSLVDQVKQFSGSISIKPDYAPWNAENSLFAIWMGVNDVGNSYWNAGISDLLVKIMDRYFAQVDILYNAGARNFALLSVPPINKSPMMLRQSQQARDNEAAVIKQFNSLVSERLERFIQTRDGVSGVVVDTQAPFNKAINNPAEYGSRDANCYNSDGKTCLWFNDYHPGLAINRLVAEAVAQTWDGTFF